MVKGRYSKLRTVSVVLTAASKAIPIGDALISVDFLLELVRVKPPGNIHILAVL